MAWEELQRFAESIRMHRSLHDIQGKLPLPAHAKILLITCVYLNWVSGQRGFPVTEVQEERLESTPRRLWTRDKSIRPNRVQHALHRSSTEEPRNTQPHSKRPSARLGCGMGCSNDCACIHARAMGSSRSECLSHRDADVQTGET